MANTHQDAICAFVRWIVSERTGEPIAVAGRPELERRDTPAVEELWDGVKDGYAVEHTRIESFGGQIETDKTLTRMLGPIPAIVAGSLPGTYILIVNGDDARRARIKHADAQREIAGLVRDAAGSMKDGETRSLASNQVPFAMALRRRDGRNSKLSLRNGIVGDLPQMRLERVRRAFDAKWTKLARWSSGSRRSVLVLESDDPQLANVFEIFTAVKAVLDSRTENPDLVVLVETDAIPMNGWVLKDGGRIECGIPGPDGNRLYVAQL